MFHGRFGIVTAPLQSGADIKQTGNAGNVPHAGPMRPRTAAGALRGVLQIVVLLLRLRVHFFNGFRLKALCTVGNKEHANG